MLFRLIVYLTDADNKYEAIDRLEYFGNGRSIWQLWSDQARILGRRHVEVFNLAGERQDPEKGVDVLMTHHV